MAKSAALHATYVPSRALLIVLRCRKEKWKMADGIRSFFESIFHAA